MSAPRPYEDELLADARAHLAAITRKHARDDAAPVIALDVLEAAASRVGGFALAQYRRLDDRARALTERAALDCSEEVLRAVERTAIPPSLALCALARQPLPRAQEKSLGSFYTDFRLARHVAARAGEIERRESVVDPACGTGILLVACGLAACGADRHAAARWIAERVWGADLDPDALRGARIALASLCDDLAAIKAMRPHLLCHDSLLAGRETWSDGEGAFDLVVANPPWEKVKATRHEFLQAQGDDRHYGATYGQTALPFVAYDAHRRGVADYAATLVARYASLRRGEADLYIAFSELFLRLVRPGGRVSALVPAGLIRSQGTEGLRRLLLDSAVSVDFEILENRARFFGIDTRFKFLSLVAHAGTPGEHGKRKPLAIRHARGTPVGIEETGRATIGREALERVRPDLSVPEVRSASEWRLFVAMCERGESWTERASPWFPSIVREVDMTRDRDHFLARPRVGALPLVEGRMVHQHRFGAKGYRSGSGRRARWEPLPIGTSAVEPQFWFARDRLSAASRPRVERVRAGFCDITGQTNERSMLAALVPSGVVCGNKVPTITFDNDPSIHRLYVWLAIANSVPFDWMLRRVVTTTVNYFVLQSLPLPAIPVNSLPWRTLVMNARKLHDLDSSGRAPHDAWEIAEARVAIDLVVATAYGVTYEDLALMLEDFPLLDRGQPPIAAENRSTVTRDFILTRAAQRFGEPTANAGERLSAARAMGAIPYVPSEFTAFASLQSREAEDA